MTDIPVICPKCHRNLVVKDVPVQKSEEVPGRHVLKARVVLLEEGKVLAKCRGCGNIVRLPLRVSDGRDL